MTDEEFNSADCYDCCDDREELIHSDIEDAIESHLDDAYDPALNETARQTLARIAPIEVFAFKRNTVPDDWAKSMAQFLFEKLAEEWDEDFGDFHGSHEPWSPAEQAELHQMFITTIETAVEYGEVWRCDSIGSRTFTEAEILDMGLAWMGDA